MKRVIVGMSGGVDSSLAAALLKERGFEVVGLFMRNWKEKGEDGCCTADEDFADVKNVCDTLDIPYYSVDFSEEYAQRVFQLFVEEYKKGRTPNPDVLCNKEIKFDAFAKYATAAGGDFIATGHYCNVGKFDGKTWLMRAKDDNKDQTYFLNQLKEEQLENVMFPLGDLTKPQVRNLAQKYGLATAQKKDSTGICFIGERNFRSFLSQYIPMQRGDIKTLDGTVVGQHEGVFYYTVGQRRGLGIGGGKGGDGRWFVIDKDVAKNTLFVTQNESLLMSDRIFCDSFNFITQNRTDDFDCLCRIRHRQPLQKARAYVKNGGLELVFKQKQRAAAEGQYAVVYDGDFCLGGGVIDKVYY